MTIEAVDCEAFEGQLDIVRVLALGEREGVFGPGSAVWRVDREAAIFLGAGRAIAPIGPSLGGGSDRGTLSNIR